MDGKNQSVNPPPACARAETPAPVAHAGDCIAVVFALPVPIAVLTAPAMLELVSLHHAIPVDSMAPHVFGAIS
jgi:hypothetical protein